MSKAVELNELEGEIASLSGALARKQQEHHALSNQDIARFSRQIILVNFSRTLPWNISEVNTPW